MWQWERCRVVAVSPQAAVGLKTLCNLDATVIMNGIDLEVFHPRPERRKEGLILHAITDMRKGADILPEVAKLLPLGLHLEFLNATDGVLVHEVRRWCEGGLAFFPTRYEGAAYASLEAAACGIPQLHYATGQAMSFDDRCGRVVDDLSPTALAWHLEDMANRLDAYDPHAWVQERASYPHFAQQWRDYLDV